MSEIRANVPMHEGEVSFVGGLGHDRDDREKVWRGNAMGEPFKVQDEWWIRVHVPGQWPSLLVPLENVTPYGNKDAKWAK